MTTKRATEEQAIAPVETLPVSTRLTHDQIGELAQEARREYERASTFGGDKAPALLNLLLADLLLGLKEQAILVTSLLDQKKGK